MTIAMKEIRIVLELRRIEMIRPHPVEGAVEVGGYLAVDLAVKDVGFKACRREKARCCWIVLEAYGHRTKPWNSVVER